MSYPKGGWVLVEKELSQKAEEVGHLGSSMVECLLSAQGVIPESWDRVPHAASYMEPASPSAYVSASLSVLT